jgi:N-methylhydantoinase A
MKRAVSANFRVGIDIGGTFTDFFFLGSDGTAFTKKLLSTPDDYSRAVAMGIKEVLSEKGLSGSAITQVIHGTTIVTNACIELSGAKVGLITTKGFRDVLEISRGRMPQLYDLAWSRSVPLVPRYLRFEVDERVSTDGDIIRPLNVNEVVNVIDKLVSQGVESVAVCLYNSPKNSLHEEKIGELLRQRASHLYVSLSTKIRPLMKEYERTSETVVNAYVRPVVARYLGSLRKVLDDIGVTAPLFVMQSSGGMMTADEAAEMPVEIVECGPAAGVVAAAYIAIKQGTLNMISLDLGGTTCKASIVEDGKYSRSEEYEVGAGIHRASRLRKGKGYCLRVPSIDIAEIGAGGGSIVQVDASGFLKVGPRSAGPLPGPACYNRGGEEATLTDCYVALGYLNPNYLLGGDFKLSPEKAYQAIANKVAKTLGLGVTEAAYAAYRIANSDMRRAITSVSSERGRDPRKFALVVFGGAGALHGAEVARELAMQKIIITSCGGCFSAFGLLCANIERHYMRTFGRTLEESGLRDMSIVLKNMTDEALAAAQKNGYDKDKVQIDRYADIRYKQQASELTIPIPVGTLTKATVPLLQEAFDKEHQKTYGHSFTGRLLDVINLRVVSSVYVPEPPIDSLARIARRLARRDGEMRKAYFGEQYGRIDTPVVVVEELGPSPRSGPLLIDGYDSTVVVPPGCDIIAMPGRLVITINGKEA